MMEDWVAKKKKRMKNKEAENQFQRLPDDVVLNIFDKLSDIQCLCRCFLVSKRFACLIPHVQTVSIGSKTWNSKYDFRTVPWKSIYDHGGTFPLGDLSESLITDLVFRPLRVLHNRSLFPTSPRDVSIVMFHARLKHVRALNIELPSAFVGNNDSVFKWGAKFTPNLNSVTFLYASSLSKMMESEEEEEAGGGGGEEEEEGGGGESEEEEEAGGGGGEEEDEEEGGGGEEEEEEEEEDEEEGGGGAEEEEEDDEEEEEGGGGEEEEEEEEEEEDDDNDNDDDNGITNRERNRRVFIAIECIKDAVLWLGILNFVTDVLHSPTMLQHVTITDSNKKGAKLCLSGEKLAECRNIVRMLSLKDMGRSWTLENMRVGYVPVLQLPVSEYVMKGVTIVNYKMFADDDYEPYKAMVDAFAEEQDVFSEAMVQIQEKHKGCMTNVL